MTHAHRLGLIAVLLTMTALPASASLQSASKTPQTATRESAIALEQQGKWSEAEAAWRQYASSHPASSEPYARMALIAARQERYAEAIPLYRKALALQPGLRPIRLDLGLALFKSGQMKGAVAEFLPLLRTAKPGSAEAQQLTILLGMAHYGMAQYAQAVPYLKRAATQDTQNLPLRLALAHSCLWSKEFQCVLDTYHEILLLNAESAEADMLAGEALDELKDKAGAIKQFQAAVKADPKAPNVHFGLGYLYWSQRRYAEAEPEFKLELANDPAHALAMLYLGDLYMQSEKPQEATPLLEKALQLDPSLWRANLDLGIIYGEADRKTEALAQLQKAAAMEPNEVNIHWRLARLYRAMGRKDEAKAEFDKASRLNKSAEESLYKKMSPVPSQASPDAAATQAPNP